MVTRTTATTTIITPIILRVTLTPIRFLHTLQTNSSAASVSKTLWYRSRTSQILLPSEASTPTSICHHHLRQSLLATVLVPHPPWCLSPSSVSHSSSQCSLSRRLPPRSQLLPSLRRRPRRRREPPWRLSELRCYVVRSYHGRVKLQIHKCTIWRKARRNNWSVYKLEGFSDQNVHHLYWDYKQQTQFNSAVSKARSLSTTSWPIGKCIH